MTKYLKTVIILLVLSVSGCDLGYIEPVYNLTPCPVWVATSLSNSSELHGPFLILPGKASSIVTDKPVIYTQIDVTGTSVAHHYDSGSLAALRPSGSGLDRWGYTDIGLIFLNSSPKHMELNKISKKSCAKPSG